MEKKKPKYPGDDPKSVTVPRIRRSPKKGDRVFAQGHHGAYMVVDINASDKTVELRLIGPREHFERGIPWGALSLLTKRMPAKLLPGS